MALDLFFLAILITLVALGAWRGAVVTGAGLLGLIAGYLGALLAGSLISGWVGDTLGLPQLLAPAVAGSLGFLAAWIVMNGLARFVVAWDEERTRLGRDPRDRALGGLLGLIRGVMLIVLLAVLVRWLDAARDLGAIEGWTAWPDAESSVVAGASGRLVETAVGQALSEAGSGGELVARLTAHPGKTLASAKGLLEDERVTELLSDRLFWTLIQTESVEYAMNRSSVRAIVQDREIRGHFADLGLVDESARESPPVFRAAIAGMLAEVAPRVHRLQQDPEIRSIAADPEIIRLMQARNTMALIRHPRIQRLVQRLSTDPLPEPGNAP